jgi:H+/Cl- antiporter ClcA
MPKKTLRRFLDYGLLALGPLWVAMAMYVLAKGEAWALSWNRVLFDHNPYWLLVVMPVGFALIRLATHKLAPQAAGSGIPQAMAVIQMGRVRSFLNTLISPLQAAYKTVFVILGMLCGASIGREGPAIQIGSAIMAGWSLKAVRRVRISPRTLVIIGGAAGLASAFTTPLAGAMYAFEELGSRRHFRSRSFALLCIIASAWISYRLFDGYSPLALNVPTPSLPTAGVLMLACVVCGLLAGSMTWLMGTGLPRIMPTTRTPLQAAGLAAAVGFVLAALAIACNGLTLGSGNGVAYQMLNLSPEHANTMGFGLMKWLSTTLSFATGIPGGILAPSLSVGAGIGQDLSLYFVDGNDRVFLIAAAMAAFLAGVIQAPLTATLVVVEMTGMYDHILAMLMMSFGATWVARLLCPTSLYVTLMAKFIPIAPSRNP